MAKPTVNPFTVMTGRVFSVRGREIGNGLSHFRSETPLTHSCTTGFGISAVGRSHSVAMTERLSDYSKEDYTENVGNPGS